MTESIFIGFDPREAAAFAVARHSIKRHLTRDIPIHGLVLADLQERGLYTRPIEYRSSAADGPIMWDTISDAPMSTEFACSRFLVKELANEGWAMFCDGDILCRHDVGELFDSLDSSVPLYCVKHNHQPSATLKMDNRIQTAYPKKNWSSVYVINVGHKANRTLTLEVINRIPGRELHAFSWLNESDIGELDPSWNYLVGESKKVSDPKLVHFTLGLPDMKNYENCEYAESWRKELRFWASGELAS